MEKTPLMQLLEIRRGQSIEALLTERVEAGMSWADIARDLEIPYPTLNDWRRSLKAREARTLVFGGAEGP